MFKKTILAAAVASFASGVLAADIDTNTTADIYTTQGIASIGKFTTPTIQVDLNAEYKADDLLTFTFSTDLDSAFTPAASLSATLVDGNDTMTLGLLSSTANSLTYRITELTYDGLLQETTVGGNIQLTVDLDADAVRAAGLATVTYAAETASSVALDTAGDLVADVITTKSQFAAATGTNFDAVIDVEDDRLTFVGAAVLDTFVVDMTEDVAGIVANSGALVTGVTYTVTGNFSFLDEDPATDGVQYTAARVAAVDADGAAGITIDSVTATEIVYTNTEIKDTTLTVSVEGAVVDGAAPAELDPQSFTVETVVNYTDAGVDGDNTANADDVAGSEVLQAAGTTAGAWGLNGSQITFPYAPIGYFTGASETYTSFEIANSGSQDGEIQVTAFDQNGDTYSETLSVMAEAGKVVRVNSFDLESALGVAADGAKKLRITFTINAPAADIRIYGYVTSTAGRTVLDNSVYEGCYDATTCSHL